MLTGRGRGWPLLADDLFRLTHRDSTGEPLLDPRVTGLGLSAALVGELLLTGYVTVRSGIVVAADGVAPSDVLAHAVWDQLVRERRECRHHSVRTWLAYLGRDAHENVAGRLERAGHVRREVSRRPVARRVRYVPTDINTAAWPWARLSGLLRPGGRLDDIDVLLGALTVATDLHRVVLAGEAGAFAAALQPLTASAADPVRELITHARAAAGDAVITKT